MAENPSARLGLPRSTRLKQRSQFAHAKARGLRLVCGCLIANVAPLPPDSSSRLGVVTSRKIGGAVQRSRARRLLRESFRLHQFELARPVDIVLVARPSIAGKAFAEVERDFLRAVKQAQLERPAA
jgi:ribonuclease P protein component